MKTLVYMVAVGDEARELAVLCVASLRNAGAYGGDILVLSDGPSIELDAYGCAVVETQGDAHPNLWRWLLADQVPADAYDQIMYLDVDILARKPIAPLWCAGVGLRYAVEANLINDNPLTNRKCMGELEAEGLPVLNSGQWVCAASLFPSFTATMRKEIEAAQARIPGFKNDQSAFQRVARMASCCDGTPIYARPFPPGSVNFSSGTRRYTDAILWHYNRQAGKMREAATSTGDVIPALRGGHNFNAGVLRRPYGWLVADRLWSPYRNDVVLRRFDSHWQELHQTAPVALHGMQDVRLVIEDGEVVGYGCKVMDPDTRKSVVMHRISIIDIPERLDAEAVPLVPSFPALGTEKNWQPIPGGLLSYSLVPHMVLRSGVNGACEKAFVSVAADWSWPWGEARGGTPWLPMGDVMLCAFHSWIDRKTAERAEPWREAHAKGRHYFCGWLLAEAVAPFRLLAVSARPIDIPEYDDEDAPHFVTFPMSLWRDGDTIGMAYGQNDRRTKLAEFSWESIKAELRPLTTAPAPLGAVYD